MFKIGDFSRLSRVSVKTLHHYDEIGLLKPINVDLFTGYRYYSFEQLPRLNRILALKDLGFSLEQIASLVDDSLTAEQLRGMLKLRLSELQRQMNTTQERLERVAARLKMIEEEGKMSDYEVVLKPVQSLKIVSAREVVPTPAQMRERCIALTNEVCAMLGSDRLKDVTLSLALYHDNNAEGIDVEMAMALPESSAPPVPSGRVKVYELPAVPTMASAIYHGSYDDFGAVGNVYGAVVKWIEANGYRMIGPSRELYLRAPQLGVNDPSGIMEIQFPVDKRS